MEYVDPLNVMRNPQTLAAYRRYQREVRAAGQPWLTIAIALAVIEIGYVLVMLLRNHLAGGVLISSLLIFAFGLSFAIAALRMWLFRRCHPLELP